MGIFDAKSKVRFNGKLRHLRNRCNTAKHLLLNKIIFIDYKVKKNLVDG